MLFTWPDMIWSMDTDGGFAPILSEYQLNGSTTVLQDDNKREVWFWELQGYRRLVSVYSSLEHNGLQPGSGKILVTGALSAGRVIATCQSQYWKSRRVILYHSLSDPDHEKTNCAGFLRQSVPMNEYHLPDLDDKSSETLNKSRGWLEHNTV